MDNNAFRKLSYGLYVVSSKDSKKDNGCIANTFTQVTSSPAGVCITLNKDNYTTNQIKESKIYNVAVLLEEVDMDLIRNFGFQSGKDVDKYANIKADKDSLGIKYPTEGVAAVFSVEVTKEVELSTHIMFIGEVKDAKVLNDKEVLTYANYHKIKNGATPKNAPSYIEEKKTGWRCSVCGYIYEGENLPEDFICPVCKQPASVFEKI
ncbi:MAG: flavin reductase [Thomasclavelia sp.]|jgi:flavin reductase (DIM6/NTAB) family NADH-FMN oxidoreductase RutF/rubredoxin|nr:flavin reductase [Thomasclavelia sp.]